VPKRPLLRFRAAVGQHPLEVHPLVELVHLAQEGCLLEGVRGEQRAHHEQPRVDGREFALPHPLAALPVDEVIEPAALVFELQVSVHHSMGAAERVCAGEPAAANGYRQARQRVAARRDAGDLEAVALIIAGAVFGEPAVGVRLAPEKVERALRQLLQERSRVYHGQGIRFISV
jgi:hypothetical protein